MYGPPPRLTPFAYALLIASIAGVIGALYVAFFLP